MWLRVSFGSGAWRGAEEGAFLVVGDAGRLDVGVDILLQGMVGRHLVLLAAFLVEPQPGPFSLSVVVLDRHCNHGANAGEGEDHRGDECPVAQADEVRALDLLALRVLPMTRADRDAVEKGAGLLGGEHRRLALRDDVLGAANRVGRVDVDDLAGDQPVEEHADGGELLLDRRLGVVLLELLDIGGDQDRLDGFEVADAAVLAPAEEVDGVAEVRTPGVRVADVGGEVFGEAGDGVFAGGGDDRRQSDPGDDLRAWECGLDRHQFLTRR